MGDFTLWEPVEMEREESEWVVEVDIPVGTHHFGFVVDGEWFLPPEAPDAVPDDWGRMNATLVIEGLMSGASSPLGVDPEGVSEK